MTEKQEDYVTDALEMIGAGYDQPTVLIESPRIVSGRVDGQIVDIEEPAWVKFSTNFKKELKGMNAYSLKVFIYIGLSVNFQSGVCWPGLRKIAEGTGFDKDTVAKAVEDLEASGFMTVQKREGNSSIYKPIRYISIGRTVRPEGTPDSQPSDGEGQPSDENAQPSDGSTVNLHNKNNKNKQENNTSSFPSKKELPSSRPASPPKTKATQTPRPPAPSTLIIAAFLKYFGLTLLMSYKAHNAFVKWATDEVKMTPGVIAYAANSWNNDEVLNWKGKRKANIILITENWSSLTEGYQETSHQSQPARQMTREDMIDLGGI